MKFVAILVAFFVVQYRGSGEIVHRDGWYRRWLRLLASLPGGGRPWLHPVVAVALPVLALQALLWWLNGLWVGLPLLAVATVVLLYSLGRGHYAQLVDTYLAELQRGDLQAAYCTAQEFSHSESVELAEDFAGLHRYAVEATLYQGFERWFAVIFWFVLLGPAAALAYRLGWLYVETEPEPVAGADIGVRRALQLAEWLPVRLLGLSFAVAGNFGSCYHVWREHLGGNSFGTAERLRLYGIAALGESEQLVGGGDCSEAVALERAIEQIRALQSLLSRAAVVWLLAIAVYLIALA